MRVPHKPGNLLRETASLAQLSVYPPSTYAARVGSVGSPPVYNAHQCRSSLLALQRILQNCLQRTYRHICTTLISESVMCLKQMNAQRHIGMIPKTVPVGEERAQCLVHAMSFSGKPIHLCEFESPYTQTAYRFVQQLLPAPSVED